MPFWDGSFGIAESPYCMEPVPWWLDLSSHFMNKIHIESHLGIDVIATVECVWRKQGSRNPLMGKPCKSRPLCGEFLNRLKQSTDISVCGAQGSSNSLILVQQNLYKLNRSRQDWFRFLGWKEGARNYSILL